MEKESFSLGNSEDSKKNSEKINQGTKVRTVIDRGSRLTQTSRKDLKPTLSRYNGQGAPCAFEKGNSSSSSVPNDILPKMTKDTNLSVVPRNAPVEERRTTIKSAASRVQNVKPSSQNHSATGIRRRYMEKESLSLGNSEDSKKNSEKINQGTKVRTAIDRGSRLTQTSRKDLKPTLSRDNGQGAPCAFEKGSSSSVPNDIPPKLTKDSNLSVILRKAPVEETRTTIKSAASRVENVRPVRAQNLSATMSSSNSAVGANPSVYIPVDSGASTSTSEVEKIKENQPDGNENPSDVTILGPWTRVQISSVEYMQFRNEQVASKLQLSELEAPILEASFVSYPSYVMQNKLKDSFMLILPDVFFILDGDVVYMRSQKYPYKDKYGEMLDLAESVSGVSNNMDFSLHALERVFDFTLRHLNLKKPWIISRCQRREVERFISTTEGLKKVAQECLKSVEDRYEGWYIRYFIISCDEIAKDIRHNLARNRSIRGGILSYGGLIVGCLGVSATAASGYISSKHRIIRLIANDSEYALYALAATLILCIIVFLFF